MWRVEGCVSPFLRVPKVGAPGGEVASHLTLQEVSRPGAAGSERILLDILEHDWREAQDSRQELCQKLHAVQGELQWAEELRDKVGTTACLPTPIPTHQLPLNALAWGGHCQAWWVTLAACRRWCLQ